MRAPLIIDCHGHYTTAPKALEEWRNKQIAGLKDPSAGPKVSDLRSATTNCANRSKPTSCA
jgi:4-oxalmesaconate hydratase